MVVHTLGCVRLIGSSPIRPLAHLSRGILRMGAGRVHTPPVTPPRSPVDISLRERLPGVRETRIPFMR